MPRRGVDRLHLDRVLDQRGREGGDGAPDHPPGALSPFSAID